MPTLMEKVKEMHAPTERAPTPKLEQFEQQNEVALDYNPYKITIYVFILI